MPFLYREFQTQEEIDAQYDVEKAVPDFTVYARHYVDESERVRQALPVQLDVPYGPTLDETVDIFPAPSPGSPVFVFIHGGAWRILAARSFPPSPKVSMKEVLPRLSSIIRSAQKSASMRLRDKRVRRWPG